LWFTPVSLILPSDFFSSEPITVECLEKVISQLVSLKID
jgi:hypothetical protein